MERSSALVSILFTDLVRSTELLARAGDDDAQRIFRAHHALLAETAAAHGGSEVKWLGDGLMAAFASAADALRCAIAMQQATLQPVAGERLTIRVGLNAGEAFRDETDFFGTPVVVARRLCDRAGAGHPVHRAGGGPAGRPVRVRLRAPRGPRPQGRPPARRGARRPLRDRRRPRAPGPPAVRGAPG